MRLTDIKRFSLAIESIFCVSKFNENGKNLPIKKAKSKHTLDETLNYTTKRMNN